MQPNILSRLVRRLLERIEHFPIPVEDALWAYACCLSGPPGHEAFSFPLLPYEGAGPIIRDEVARHPPRYRREPDGGLQSAGAVVLVSPSVTA